MLCRRVGVQHIEAVEDAVQGALMAALESWPIAGLPDSPSAWLYRAAHNDLIGKMRQRTRRSWLLKYHAAELCETPEDSSVLSFGEELADDLLRMLFVCCDEAIPRQSQLVLALKTLCGFDIREISFRPFVTEANLWGSAATYSTRYALAPMPAAFWMSALAYLLPTFPLGHFWHLETFRTRYDRLGVR